MQNAREGETELDYSSSSSDESLKEVHFDDSEEERDLGIEDGFDLRDVGQAEEALNEIVENMKNQSDEANTNTEPVGEMHMDPSVGEGSANVESFVPADVAVMHEIEEEYVSDELDSGVEDGSDDNGKPREATEFGEQAQDDDVGDKAVEEAPNEEGEPMSLGSPQPNHELDN
ncbi:hypothetical protein SESBI_02997 [Sesbania bispinosa]|nr:hypothetical protein SESBI_02997 [Sesbania bispinosa]